jgi:DNA-binding CsgD family transcriptional regulator
MPRSLTVPPIGQAPMQAMLGPTAANGEDRPRLPVPPDIHVPRYAGDALPGLSTGVVQTEARPTRVPLGGVSAALTPREHETLIMLAAGFKDREIADQLFVSPKTIEKHVASLRKKLNAPSRAAAVANAMHLGLI